MQIMFSRKRLVHNTVFMVRYYLKEMTDSHNRGNYYMCEHLYNVLNHKLIMLHHLGILDADKIFYLKDIVSAYYSSLV